MFAAIDETPEIGEKANNTESSSSNDNESSVNKDSDEEQTTPVDTDIESEPKPQQTADVVDAAGDDPDCGNAAGSDDAAVQVMFHKVTDCKQARVGMWILAKLDTDSGRHAKFFVAKTDSVYHMKREICVTFLKQYRSKVNQFVQPSVEDTSILKY